MTRRAKRHRNWIVSVREVTFRVRRQPSRSDKIVDTPAKAAALLRALRAFPDDGREHVAVLLVDVGLRVLAWHKVGTGTVDGCILSPRDVFGPALRVLGTRGVIVAHNHPSGDPFPSQNDLDLTIDLARTGEIVGIECHDHVVLADGSDKFTSIVDVVKNEGGGAGKRKKE